MGLSNEERTSGIYHALSKLNSIRREWLSQKIETYERKEYVYIFDLIEKTWSQFLSSHSNGLHWIVGSASSNSITDDAVDPWSVAICYHLRDKLAEEDRYFNPTTNDEPFDAKDYVNISSLVRQENVSFYYLFEIYRWLEQLSYYLRRYDDDFRQNLIGLDNTMSTLMGEFFTIFRDNEVFAKAYIIVQIMDHLYGPGYPYRDEAELDLVTNLMVKHNFHHDLSLLINRKSKCTTKELAQIHVSLVKGHAAAEFEWEQMKAEVEKDPKHKAPIEYYYENEEFLKARLLAVIALVHSLYKHDHVFKDFVVRIKAAKLNFEDKIIEALEQAKNKFKAEHEEEDCFGFNSHSMKALDAYGCDGYFQLNDYVKSLKAKKIEDKTQSKVKKKVKKKVK